MSRSPGQIDNHFPFRLIFYTDIHTKMYIYFINSNTLNLWTNVFVTRVTYWTLAITILRTSSKTKKPYVFF